MNTIKQVVKFFGKFIAYIGCALMAGSYAISIIGGNTAIHFTLGFLVTLIGCMLHEFTEE